MGERYWITGVQLGMLQELKDYDAKVALVERIVDGQFLGHVRDLKRLRTNGKKRY